VVSGAFLLSTEK